MCVLSAVHTMLQALYIQVSVHSGNSCPVIRMLINWTNCPLPTYTAVGIFTQTEKGLHVLILLTKYTGDSLEIRLHKPAKYTLLPSSGPCYDARLPCLPDQRVVFNGSQCQVLCRGTNVSTAYSGGCLLLMSLLC